MCPNKEGPAPPSPPPWKTDNPRVRPHPQKHRESGPATSSVSIRPSVFQMPQTWARLRIHSLQREPAGTMCAHQVYTRHTRRTTLVHCTTETRQFQKNSSFQGFLSSLSSAHLPELQNISGADFISHSQTQTEKGNPLRAWDLQRFWGFFQSKSPLHTNF